MELLRSSNKQGGRGSWSRHNGVELTDGLLSESLSLSCDSALLKGNSLCKKRQVCGIVRRFRMELNDRSMEDKMD